MGDPFAPATPPPPIRYSRGDALLVAKPLMEAFASACLPGRLIIAGSVRRRKLAVKDIEIVYVSRTEQNQQDLFGPPAETPVMDRVLAELIAAGVIARRKNKAGSEVWGAANKFAVHVDSGMPIDLFATTEEAWFNYLVCRTGGERNNTEIATAARSRGWRWTPYGAGFVPINSDGLPDCRRQPHVVRSERAVFDFVRLPFRDPWERE